MKIITQISMFDDTQNENLGDLERLQKVLENLPDEKLIHKLKHKRKQAQAVSFRSPSSIDHLCKCMSMLILMRRKEQTNLFREIAEIFA